MHWREKGEKMNPDDPSNDRYDTDLCDRLKASPMRLVEMPEHVLVMFGYSRNYISLFMEPIIVYKGKGMCWVVKNLWFDSLSFICLLFAFFCAEMSLLSFMKLEKFTKLSILVGRCSKMKSTSLVGPRKFITRTLR
jgi:hypothetical protein